MLRSSRRARRSSAAVRAPRRLCRRPCRSPPESRFFSALRRFDGGQRRAVLLVEAQNLVDERRIEPAASEPSVERGRDRAEPERYRAWRTAPLCSPQIHSYRRRICDGNAARAATGDRGVFCARARSRRRRSKRVALDDALGRVLARRVVADDDYPNAPRSRWTDLRSRAATPGEFD